MGSKSGVKVGGVFTFVCRDPEGSVKWTDKTKNLVVTEGLNHLLDVLLCGGSQVGTWYVGMTAGTPEPAAGHTMASHSGWTEVTAYDEATRQAYTEARTNQTVSNSANPATYTIDTNNTTVGGAFLVSNNTKGGSTGTLLCVAAFTAGNKVADDNDTIEVTYQFSGADDGV